MQAVILALVMPVLQVLFSAVTPAIRELMSQYLRDLYSKALASPSPWDDFAVGILCGLTGVSTSGVVATTAGGVTMPVTVSKAIMSSAFPVVASAGSVAAAGAITNNPPLEPIPGMQGS